ncbi:MAG: hypothetical protein A2033_14880 [Bacteroidetes bacterium GWA2_31_9]|nr:MAG: hypothetical protein A2033_14880 [Bacteroidetes bacterium GWA2_31_9]
MSFISNEYISLRAIEPEDIELIYSWENDSNIWHLGNTIIPFSKETIKKFIFESANNLFIDCQLRLMIDLNETNQTIGSIDLYDFDAINMKAGVGVILNSEFRNNGYALKALKLLIDYCFNILNLKQLYCHIAVNNEKSIKLFEKADFQQSGKLKDWIKKQGKREDVFIFQLINQSIL